MANIYMFEFLIRAKFILGMLRLCV